MIPSLTLPKEITEADLFDPSIADISPKLPPDFTSSRPTIFPSSASWAMITEPSE